MPYIHRAKQLIAVTRTNQTIIKLLITKNLCFETDSKNKQPNCRDVYEKKLKYFYPTPFTPFSVQ